MTTKCVKIVTKCVKIMTTCVSQKIIFRHITTKRGLQLNFPLEVRALTSELCNEQISFWSEQTL